jgi:hypothetical protein
LWGITVGGAIQVRVINLSTSSIRITGAEIHNTAIHSSILSGIITNNLVKKGTYKIIKCKAIDKAIDNTRYGLFHKGNVNNDSFSLKLKSRVC